MADPNDPIITPVLIKIAGSFVGGLLALVFEPPKTRTEAFSRGAFSIVIGFTLGEPIRVNYLHWPDDWQMWFAACVLTAMLSWFVMGTAVRVIAKWSPPKKKD